MKSKASLTIITILLFLFGISAVDAEKIGFLEHKAKVYTVRVCCGPSELNSVGSYAVRVYDSDGLNFVAGIIKVREGELVKLWVLDFDEKDDIEIVIWTRVAGSGAYGKLEMFKFKDRSFREIKLPSPADSLLKGYAGHDIFDVKDGTVYRQFPLYCAKDSNATPTGGIRCLKLKLSEKVWTLSDKSL